MSYYHDDDGSDEAMAEYTKNVFMWTVIGCAIVLAIVLVLSYIFDPVKAQLVKQSGTTGTGRTTIIGGCDESLWAHVYNAQRLEVQGRCVSVTGVIVDATHGKRKDGVRKETDGDCHGWLRLDAGQEKYINAGNVSDEDGNLVYEVVCMFPVKQADAKSACSSYKNNVRLAPVGSRVRVTGSWVKDDNHARWFEIHPVSSIEVLPK